MKEVVKRSVITLLILFVYKLGMTITVPGVSNVMTQLSLMTSNFLDTISMVGGGSLSSFSIFALGVGPYITSSIVIQLLTELIPYLKKIAEEGGKGRAKLNKITRNCALIISGIQAFTFTAMFEKNYGILQNSGFQGYFIVIISMMTGFTIVMWLSDLITMYGIGNGSSIIIFAGIVSNLPSNIRYVYNVLKDKASGTLLFVLYLIMFVLIIALIVFIENSERRIPIQQSNRIVNRTDGDFSFMPLKLNSSSVIPVIFASTFMTVPPMVAGASGVNVEKISKFLSLTSITGLIIYSLLIVFFAFVYANIQIKPEKIAENFAKNGTYIPGIRPGVDTENYISKVLNHINVAGVAFLLFIALLPNVIAMVTGLPANVALGGTSLIIAVGVACEIIKTFKSTKISNRYDNYGGF